MCGVAGIYAYRHESIDRDELRTIRDDMRARGPDGYGEWLSLDGRVGLGHRRLSIIDLSDRAAQPMSSADGRLVISFNGEIYNYRALRRELEANGVEFRTESDTEVLLRLYAAKGEAMLGDLRGMFAFALWDGRKDELVLARDPYGIKPLYVADDGNTVRVASQVKALVAGGGISLQQDAAGVVGFLLWGSVPEPFTIYESVRAVPAGHLVRIDQQGVHPAQSYFSMAQIFHDARAERVDIGQHETIIPAALLDSVKHHLVADVPVGAFLSAGIDSGALVGLMQDAGQQNIQTVTLAFAEFQGQQRDEAPLAQQLARHYGTTHTTRIVTEQEFRNDLPLILQAMDQPSIDGLNTWFVAKAARELGLKVAISGLGGDELLGGYPSFREIPRWVNTLALPAKIPALGRFLRHILASHLIPHRTHSPKLAGMLEYGGSYPGAYLLKRGLFMPWELAELCGHELMREGLQRLQPLALLGAALAPQPGTPFARVATLEASFYMRNQLLRDADWASMAHSLEVRVPLVDGHLLRQLAPLLLSRAGIDGKALLAASPSKPLPEVIAKRAKSGFETPVQDWIKRSGVLHAWQQQPALTRQGCHWSRRWAYEVMSCYQSAAVAASA